MGLNHLTEDELGAMLRGLALDVVDSHIHWGQLTILQAELENRPEVTAEAWTFWHYTIVAHRHTALVCLARVFDQQRKSLHLRSLLVAIREHLNFFERDSMLQRRPEDPFAQWITPDAAKPDIQQLNQDINDCTDTDPDVNALVQFRNTLLAHRGATLTRRDDATKFPDLTHDQVDRLLERSLTLLNRYSYMFDTSIYSPKPFDHEAVKRVFETMQRDLDRQKAEAKKQA